MLIKLEKGCPEKAGFSQPVRNIYASRSLMPRIGNVHQLVSQGLFSQQLGTGCLKMYDLCRDSRLRVLHSVGADFEYPVSVMCDSPCHRVSI